MRLAALRTIVPLLGLASAGAADAQDRAERVWQITPYAWATSIDGSLTPFTGAPRLAFSSSFSEIVEDLDVAIFVSGYARFGRFVAVGDLSYSRSSRSGGIPGGAGPLPAGTLARGSLEQASVTLAAGYRVVDLDSVTVDALAGGRHWLVRSAVEVPLAGLSISPSLSFTDPILGLRANIALAPRWSVIMYGDFGGFGIGSDRTWQALATLNFRLRDDVYLSAGYRTLSIDYAEGGTRVDATMSGPIFGATWRF